MHLPHDYIGCTLAIPCTWAHKYCCARPCTTDLRPPEPAVAKYAAEFIRVRAFGIIPALIAYVATAVFRGENDHWTGLSTCSGKWCAAAFGRSGHLCHRLQMLRRAETSSVCRQAVAAQVRMIWFFGISSCSFFSWCSSARSQDTKTHGHRCLAPSRQLRAVCRSTPSSSKVGGNGKFGGCYANGSCSCQA